VPSDPPSRAAQPPLDPSDPYLRRLVVCQARKLLGKAGLNESDIDDLVQEIWSDLVQRLPGFDPRRSQHRTFCSRLVDHKASNVLRDRRAKRRDSRRCWSLNTPLMDGDDRDHADLLASDVHGGRTGCVRRSDAEQADLAADIANIMAKMPAELRDLCQRLQNQPLTAIAQEVGIPRTTLQESTKKIRRYFEDAGMKDYV
jgi:RNA polymerase sigma-70 factor, ECF subfamily